MKQGRPLTPWLFALLLAVYLVTGGGHGYSVDGGFGYEMAKTALLDPQHEYFHRFKSAFARWGALMPLLGQPLVLTGEAIARVAPERDAVTVAGHRFRVEEWPAVGPGGQQAYVGPPPPRVAVTQIAIVSFTANSAAVPQGTTVGEVRLVGDQTVTWPIRAGIETAEWAHDRPDVSNLMRHDQPRMAGHWIGQPRGNLYVATYAWPTPMVIERWELGAPLQANLPSGLTWNVRAAAFMDSDRVWHDVYTGERYWSPRQTHDFFTRLIYSTLNAFTTAAAGTLVFLIGRQFGYATTAALIGALGYGLATMAWPHAKYDFSEPAATAFVLLAIWALYRAFPKSRQWLVGSRRSPAPSAPGAVGSAPCLLPTAYCLLFGLAASIALLLAVVGKYTAALAAAAVVSQWGLSSGWWRGDRRRNALAFGAALVGPALVLGVAAFAVAARATGERPVVLTPSTIWQRLSEDWLALPFWTGFRGLVFSPGKSLFLYSPWLLLALPGTWLFWRRHGRDGVMVVWFPALVLLLYSKKLVWHGGSWGPRYMLPIVPLVALAALPAIAWCLPRGKAWRVALAALFAISVVPQLLALGKDPEQYPAMAREFIVPALPDYGTRLGGYDYWLARGGPGLARALQQPSPSSTERALGYLWGYPTAEMRIDVRERRQFSLSLYFVDWDHAHRREAVTVEDTLGRRVFNLDHDFDGGLWATWQVEAAPGAPVRIGLEQRAEDTAVLSAVAFGPARGARSDAPTVDERTKGDWRSVYGADGFVLLAWHSFSVDEARLPAYVAGYDVSHVGDKPDPRIHVDVAEGDLRDTPLLYAPAFSPLLGNAWLLAADLSHLVLPSRPDVTGAVLARPPWRWFGVRAPELPHPEYGLGLDFWPTLLYTNYASHPGVLVAMWVVLVGLEAALLMAALRLARAACVSVVSTRRGAIALVVMLAAFDWLQVRP